MEAKVIIVTATKKTEQVLNNIVKKISAITSIKSYPNVDYGAVFFPTDKHDLSFVSRLLKDKGFCFRIENAE